MGITNKTVFVSKRICYVSSIYLSHSDISNNCLSNDKIQKRDFLVVLNYDTIFIEKLLNEELLKE